MCRMQDGVKLNEWVGVRKCSMEVPRMIAGFYIGGAMASAEQWEAWPTWFLCLFHLLPNPIHSLSSRPETLLTAVTGAYPTYFTVSVACICTVANTLYNIGGRDREIHQSMGGRKRQEVLMEKKYQNIACSSSISPHVRRLPT